LRKCGAERRPPRNRRSTLTRKRFGSWYAGLVTDPKLKEVRKWAGDHAAWDLTGNPILELVKEEVKKQIRPFIGGSLSGGFASWVASHWLAAVPWLVAIAIVTFVVVLFIWDLSVAARRGNLQDTPTDHDGIGGPEPKSASDTPEKIRQLEESLRQATQERDVAQEQAAKAADEAKVTNAFAEHYKHENPILKSKVTTFEDWQAIAERFWKLKIGARIIKRRWPGSAFENRPASKLAWASAISNDQELLSTALEWHESFEAIVNFNNAYVRSLDLDGVMELLDLEERRQRGLPPPRLPDTRPIVAPERYGFQTTGAGRKVYGFYVTNYGPAAAFDVFVHMLRLGRDRVQFSNTIRTLSMEQGPIFSEQQITTNEGGNAMAGHELFDSIRDWQAGVDVYGAPIHLWISYRDSGGTCYMSNSEIVPNPTDEGNCHINVKHLIDEIVSCS